MQVSLPLFLLLFIGQSLVAQSDYIGYYNLVNQANRSWYEEDYEQSLGLFKDAFEKVDYVHTVNYAKAAMAAAKTKEYALCKDYIIAAIRSGYPTDLTERKEYKSFRKTAIFRTLQAEIVDFKMQGKVDINHSYLYKIDSLHYIDQKILRGSDNVSNFNLDPNVAYSDSANFVCLLNLINSYGFPSEQNIGYLGYKRSWVLLHHNIRLPQNHAYLPMLLVALKKGDYLPENYCWVMDQSQELLKQPLIYHHWDVSKFIGKMSAAERAKIDEKRKEVGMPSVDRIKVINTADGPRNKTLW